MGKECLSPGLIFLNVILDQIFNYKYESCVLMQINVGKNCLCKDTHVF